MNIICYTSSAAAICEGVITVKELSERIKAYRNKLHLSQEYVASFLGINRAAVTQIEAGNRKVVKVGVAFSKEEKNITEWIVE